jgi:catechol 2,3-dioxygenase-like lactoylglutathione lyase family enzyme
MKSLLKRMGHVAIEVSDLSRALTFYRDVLGLKPQWVGDEDWANLSLGGDDLSLVRSQGSVHPPHLGFYVDQEIDLQHMHSYLTVQGVKVEPIHPHRDGSKSFYFVDPDQNLLEILWMPQHNSG